MSKHIRIALTLCVLFVSCAASVSRDRRDYILAHPHGWIEVTIKDSEIPFLPPSEKEPDKPVVPYSCYVSVDLNNEGFLSDYAYPFGETEPFTVDTGFRFPAPVGMSELKFKYSGCDVSADGKESSVTIKGEIPVEEGNVTEMLFNGSHLTFRPPRMDPVVTLEDVYEAITGKRTRTK
ncbi:MAG: hypothetical protein A2Y74_02555 [Actinobacteria bacterium RBG_13_63_9]|nr:MAG: hypothetical protein A2Y74_02555 [Actinobacteria bacterium RBG_13_63_9]